MKQLMLVLVTAAGGELGGHSKSIPAYAVPLFTVYSVLRVSCLIWGYHFVNSGCCPRMVTPEGSEEHANAVPRYMSP